LALASGIGYAAAVYTLSRWLTRPSRRKPQRTPLDFGLPSRSVRCRTADGFLLRGWVIEPSGSRGTVALFHGMRGSRERMLDRVPYFYAGGYRCILFDHRAHGESSGRRTSFGFHESRDVAAVLRFIQERWPKGPRVALGTSMGAAAICYAVDHAADWDALILESCYPEIGQAFESRLRHGYPTWYQRLRRGVIWLTERRLRVRLPQLAPIDYIARFGNTPILIVTGTEDLHAAPTEAHRLFERCQGPRELWLVPRAGHRDIVEKAGAEYGERVLKYLKKHLAA
jgi:alpha-beta hydrolase superfamily lysophospholipase